MVSRHPRLPIGAGDSFVVWERAAPWLRFRRRARIEVSSACIRYVDAKDNTVELDRESGSRLRIFSAGELRKLTNGQFETMVPIEGFSLSKLASACTAEGWEFPATRVDPDEH